MQNKGVISLAVILIGLACLYQLSFTWATRNEEGKARVYAQKAVDYEQTTPAFNGIPEASRAHYLDSIFNVKERYYLDSITAETVYIGFTYKEVKEKEINLGLDLKGGMNVMLEVSVPELVVALSNNSTNQYFVQAMDLAKKNLTTSQTDFITLFGQAWNQVAPGQNMSQVFGTYEMKDKIKPATTNDEVIRVIRTEAESAISNSFNVLRNRISRFGVTQPNIQKLGATGRILVELPGVKEPARVRNLLQGTASLEFWETYENSEIAQYLTEVDRQVKDLIDAEKALNGIEANVADTTSEVTSLAGQLDSLSLAQTQFAERNPFFYALNPNIYQGQLMPGACIGVAHYKDTARELVNG